MLRLEQMKRYIIICLICIVNRNQTYTVVSATLHDRLGFYADSQIIVGTVYSIVCRSSENMFYCIFGVNSYSSKLHFLTMCVGGEGGHPHGKVAISLLSLLDAIPVYREE